MLEFSRAVNECLIVGDETIIRVIEIQPAYVRLEILQTRHPEARRIETLWLNRDDEMLDDSSSDEFEVETSSPDLTHSSACHESVGMSHTVASTYSDELDDGFLDFSDLVNWKPQEGRDEDDSRFDLETDLLPLR